MLKFLDKIRRKRAQPKIDATRDFLGSRMSIRLRALVFAAILVIGVFFFGRLSQIDYKLENFWQFQKGQLGLLCSNIFIGALGSIIASFVFVLLHESENSKLRAIQKITDQDFLNAFLIDLQHFGQRTCRDYQVNVTFSPLANRPDLLLVKIRYRYNKTIAHKKLSFKLVRSSTNSKGRGRTNHDDEFFSHECYFNLEEGDFGTAAPDDAYSFANLVIENKHTIALQRAQHPDQGRVEYSASVPNDVPLHNDINIAFEVNFPMEMESFLAINFELPTKVATIMLDYSALANQIQVVSQGFISPRFGPNEVLHSDSSSTIHLVHDGWLLPKNGIVFCWWKKT